ncbi:MAG: hypothetical protein JRH07_02920 [Deltaproteobacteria bacterium]|nr:hypothetical protein [Deltaproteobacteria bacterium]MBW2120784.1 hypothetical protein [Deltaproteobacteria bacterium]
MARGILILVDSLEVEAELNDSPTAELIWNSLPIEASANTWGEEIYFSIPVKAELEEGARDGMERGELGYWPPGDAFCIFFGPTPMSRGGEIRAASPVNPIGKVLGDPGVFKGVRAGARVRIVRR